MTTLQWYGHATFAIETDSKRLLIDPFFNDNPTTDVSADDVSADVILLTHGHFDHVADAPSIAKRTGAQCIANFEIAQWLGKQGVENSHAMHIGGGYTFDFGRVKLTPALHGSMLPDGSYGGMPAGLLLSLPGLTIYDSGDTGLFSDMQLIGEAGIDVAILAIGDNFTMGPDDSIRAIKFLKPKRVVPQHYNTWPPIEQDVQAWAQRVRQETDAEPVVLKPGETVSL